MIITFTDRPQKFSPKHRCRDGFCKSLMVVDLDTGSVRAEARFYQPRANVYCCLWIHGQNRQGSGSADNFGGICMAFLTAAHNAGINVSKKDFAVASSQELLVNAMDAIGLALGLRDFKVLEVHP